MRQQQNLQRLLWCDLVSDEALDYLSRKPSLAKTLSNAPEIWSELHKICQDKYDRMADVGHDAAAMAQAQRQALARDIAEFFVAQSVGSPLHQTDEKTKGPPTEKQGR